MTRRKEIISKVAEETGIRSPDVEKVFQKTLDVIISILARGEKIELRNFGVFKVKTRAAMTGRNPRTGEKIPVPPRKVIMFKPGLIMKRKMKDEGIKESGL